MAKKVAAVMEPEKEKNSTVCFHGPKARDFMKGLGIGEKVKLVVSGKVKSLTANDWGDSVELDLDTVTQSDGPKSPTEAIKARKQ